MFASDFFNLFDEQGRYRNGDGDLSVVFLTKSGAKYPGKLRFKGGHLTRAEMDGASPWGYPDASPLDGLKFLLHFQGEKPRAVFIDQGRVVHNFELQEEASKDKFLASLRVARNLFSHPRVEADGPTIDTSSISDALTRGAIWLTPKSVEGFDAKDFPELKADRQMELLNAVQAFGAVARQVPADKPPTKEQYGNAATAFIAILNILSPYLPTPDESRMVEKALRTVSFPPWVVNWDYELASNEEGDSAVWINVFADGNVSRNDYGRFTSQIIPKIRQALAAEGIHRWPYVRLHTATEYKIA